MVANQPPPIAFRAGHCCSRSYSSVLGAARCYVSHCNGAVPCPPPDARTRRKEVCLGRGILPVRSDAQWRSRIYSVFPAGFPSAHVVRARGTACHAGADYFVFVKGFWTAVQTPRYVVGRMWSVTWLAPRLHSHQYDRSQATNRILPPVPRARPRPPLHRAAGGTNSSSAWAPCSPTLSTSHPRSRRCT